MLANGACRLRGGGRAAPCVQRAQRVAGAGSQRKAVAAQGLHTCVPFNVQHICQLCIGVMTKNTIMHTVPPFLRLTTPALTPALTHTNAYAHIYTHYTYTRS